MDVSFYLLPFLTSFFLTIVCIALLQIIFRRWRVRENRTDARHIHNGSVLRFGGVALVAAFLGALFLNDRLVLTMSWWGVIIIAVLLLLIGLWDDIYEISWQTQLITQIVAGGLAFAFGIRMMSLSNPFGEALFFDSGWMLGASFVITVVWIFAVMNAVNWADGIDGLCGGISFIGFVTIFFLSLRPEVNQPPVAIFSLVLAGASLGFLVFNVYPARIFAGTSGSWFFGFMLAVLALFAGTKIATALLVLSLPILDAGFVIFERFQSGVSIFMPDQRHLHHRLRKLGWSSHRIALFFYSVTIGIAIIALHTNAFEKIIAFISIVFIAFGFFIYIQKQTAPEKLLLTKNHKTPRCGALWHK